MIPRDNFGVWKSTQFDIFQLKTIIRFLQFKKSSEIFGNLTRTPFHWFENKTLSCQTSS